MIQSVACLPRPRYLALVLLTTLPLAGCGGDAPTPSAPQTPTVATVEVTPGAVSLDAIGEAFDFTAVGRNASGGTVPSLSFTWSSSDPSVARFDDQSRGRATIVGPGETTITASTQGKSGTASLTVSQVVAAVRIDPPSDTISEGWTLQLTGQAVDRNGFPITDRSFQYEWGTSDAGIVEVSQDGMVLGSNPGTAEITASYDGVGGTATIEVWIIADDSAPSVMSELYATRHGLDVPAPAIHLNRCPTDDSGAIASPCVGLDPEWVSTSYVGSTLYQVVASADGEAVIVPVPFDVATKPVGVLDVLVVVVDYAESELVEQLDLWVAAQDSINRKHGAFAAAMGLSEPLVQFNNVNLAIPHEEIWVPWSADSIFAALDRRGISEGDFDLFVSLDLDPMQHTGREGLPNPPPNAFAVAGGKFSYNGWCYVDHSPEPMALCRTSFEQDLIHHAASTAYDHEIGHNWGWGHRWGGSDDAQLWLLAREMGEEALGPFPDLFITGPELFGWTDTDGDGIPEILDSTPYGR